MFNRYPRVPNNEVIFESKECSHGLPGISIPNASPEVHTFLRRVVLNQWITSFDYKFKQLSGAFVQGEDPSGEGWIFIEFWKKDGVSAFIDYVNLEWKLIVKYSELVDQAYHKYHGRFLDINERIRTERKRKYPDADIIHNLKATAKRLEQSLNKRQYMKDCLLSGSRTAETDDCKIKRIYDQYLYQLEERAVL